MNRDALRRMGVVYGGEIEYPRTGAPIPGRTSGIGGIG
jgi:hypothetical protein